MGSADFDPNDGLRAAEYGTLFLGKPFDWTDLVHIVESLFETNVSSAA